MELKKITLITLTLFALSACKISVDYKTPHISDSDKTISFIIDNVPEEFVGKVVYFFTSTVDGFYSTEKAIALENNIVNLYPPDGLAAFDILAYMPTNQQWDPGDIFTNGYYSVADNIIDRNSFVISLNWNYSNIPTFPGISVSTITSELNLSNFILDQGDILYINSVITPNYNSPVSSVKYYIDDSELASYGELPYSYALNTNDVSPGNHVVKVVAENEEGHSSMDEQEIWINSVENEAPTVVINSHFNGEEIYIGSIETVYVSVYDPDSDIDHVIFKINGTSVANLNASPFYYDWDTSTSNPGTVEIEVTAYDSHGAHRSDVINVVLVNP